MEKLENFAPFSHTPGIAFIDLKHIKQQYGLKSKKKKHCYVIRIEQRHGDFESLYFHTQITEKIEPIKKLKKAKLNYYKIIKFASFAIAKHTFVFYLSLQTKRKN